MMSDREVKKSEYIRKDQVLRWLQDSKECYGVLALRDRIQQIMDKIVESDQTPDKGKLGHKIMRIIQENWNGGSCEPAHLYAKIMIEVERFGQPQSEQPLDVKWPERKDLKAIVRISGVGAQSSLACGWNEAIDACKQALEEARKGNKSEESIEDSPWKIKKARMKSKDMVRLPERKAIENIIHLKTFEHRGEKGLAGVNYKKDCHYCNDRPWLSSIADAIIQFLKEGKTM